MKKYLLAILILSVQTILYTGCNHNSSFIGFLHDSPLIGVQYKCGTITARTSIDGKFLCTTFPVEFFIGSWKIGEIYALTNDKNIFPQDLLGVPRNNYKNTKVVKLAQLLQSLDDDGDISKSINIKGKEYLFGTNTKTETLQDIETALKDANITLVSMQSALKHLKDNVNNNNDNTTNKIPVALPIATPSTTTASCSEITIITLDASDSYDIDGNIVSYLWKEGNITLSTKSTFDEGSLLVGIHNISLTVTDNQGATDTKNVTVTINPCVHNKPPVAHPVATPSTTTASCSEITIINFDGSDSYDIDGSIISYLWKKGNTTLSNKMNFNEGSLGTGIHNISLTVTDNQGATDTKNVTVTINPCVHNKPPVAIITDFPFNLSYGWNIDFYGLDSYDTDGNITAFEWKDNGNFISNVGFFRKNDLSIGEHNISLTVTDNLGATNTTSKHLTITP